MTWRAISARPCTEAFFAVVVAYIRIAHQHGGQYGSAVRMTEGVDAGISSQLRRIHGVCLRERERELRPEVRLLNALLRASTQEAGGPQAPH